jgi:methionyl-tRNA formyltransferase
MRVVFTGSSDFSLAVFRALLGSRHDVVGAITQPDRPQGRGRKVQPSPVKAEALARGIAVWTPEKAGDEAFLDTLRAARPDAVAVAAYGQILTQRFLDIPPRGCVNVHPSLVPRYRGASPIAHAVLNGDAMTGVSIFHVVRKMDAGPVYARREAAIAPDETTGELEARLAPIGASLLVEVLDAIEAGTSRSEPQDESGVVLAPKLEKEAGRVDWSEPAARVACRIRAMNPWPCVHAVLRGPGHAAPVRVKLLRAVPAEHVGGGAPGAVLAVAKEGVLVAAGTGAVRIVDLQPEGKRPMAARDFANGYRVGVGDRFEDADTHHGNGPVP